MFWMPGPQPDMWGQQQMWGQQMSADVNSMMNQSSYDSWDSHGSSKGYGSSKGGGWDGGKGACGGKDSGKSRKGGGKSGGKGKGGKKGEWYPDEQDIWMAAQVMTAIGAKPDGLLAKAKGSKGKGKSQGQVKNKFAATQATKKSGSSDMPWKSRLLQAWGKAYHKPPSKEDIVWKSEEVEGGYTSVVSCEQFTHLYESDQVYETQKMAEGSAAKEALEGEYPEIYKAIPQQVKNAGASAGLGTQTAGAAKPAPARPVKEEKVRGEKRKKGPAHTNVPDHMNKDFKSRFNVAMLMCVARPITKDELAYATVTEGDKETATLTVKCFDGEPTVFQGEASGTGKDVKKEAEGNAAEAALEHYRTMIEEKTPEHEARKAQKMIEREARFAAKKAEKEAT